MERLKLNLKNKTDYNLKSLKPKMTLTKIDCIVSLFSSYLYNTYGSEITGEYYGISTTLNPQTQKEFLNTVRILLDNFVYSNKLYKYAKLLSTLTSKSYLLTYCNKDDKLKIIKYDAEVVLDLIRLSFYNDCVKITYLTREINLKNKT